MFHVVAGRGLLVDVPRCVGIDVEAAAVDPHPSCGRQAAGIQLLRLAVRECDIVVYVSGVIVMGCAVPLTFARSRMERPVFRALPVSGGRADQCDPTSAVLRSLGAGYEDPRL